MLVLSSCEYFGFRTNRMTTFLALKCAGVFLWAVRVGSTGKALVILLLAEFTASEGCSSRQTCY